jgi:hypothetical protein
MVLSRGSLTPIPRGWDPLTARFSRIARQISPHLLGETELTAADMDEALGLGRGGGPRLLLGYYTAHGVEYALHHYGILEQLQRIGYRNLRVEIDPASLGDRVRLLGWADGTEHLLVEEVLERRPVAGRDALFVHWLSLRNPRAQFSERRPRLPGQEVPGLGMAREFGELLSRIAKRLSLAGVAYRPAHYHTAYQGRHQMAFVDPARQGRFEALIRDTAGISVLETTTALDRGRVRMNGEPYAWEPDDMVDWLQGEPGRAEAIAAERERVRFTVE